jgi:hypothetical protein
LPDDFFVAQRWIVALDLVIDDDSRKFELSAKGAYSVDQARLGGLIDVDFDFSGEELTNESVKSHEAAEF